MVGRMRMQSYLGELEEDLHLAPEKRSEIIAEIRTHMEDRLAELERRGVPYEVAAEQAQQEIGDPHQLAQGFYASYSTGSWRDTLLAITPHLLLAALFALHLWTNPLLVILLAGAAIAVAVVAWFVGRPQWAYPWLGYALSPLAVSWMVAVAVLVYGVWNYFTWHYLPLGLPIYLGMALWVPLMGFVAFRVLRKAVLHDWPAVSLASLPLPLIAAWLFLLHWGGGQVVLDEVRALEADASTAMVFVALALTTGIYMKVGRRGWRIALIMVAVPMLVAVVTAVYQMYPTSFQGFIWDEASRMFASLSQPGPAMLPIVASVVLTVMFLSSPSLLEGPHRGLSFRLGFRSWPKLVPF